jgi:DeoR family ulaG and ulaABCDEF operon transcriptional repressor
MQADVVLVAAERRLIDRAEEVILLVDSSKFATQSGTIVCDLDEIDTIITDAIPADLRKVFEKAGVRVIIA